MTEGQHEAMADRAGGFKRVIALGGSALLALVACGDSDESPAQPATEEGLVATAEAWNEAFIDDPPTTYDYLSADCRDSMSRSDWSGELLLGTGFFESVYGFEMSELTVGDIEVVEFDGETGAIAVELTGPDGEPLEEEDAEEWRYEDDQWVTDNCDTFSEGDQSSEVSTETALGWPEKFCQLSEGMTREEVRSIMGEPTSEFLDSNSQDGYQAYQFNITVFYNAPRAQDDDPMQVRVKSLSADSTGQFTEMTTEDIKLFPCADRVFDEATLDAARENSDG